MQTVQHNKEENSRKFNDYFDKLVCNIDSQLVVVMDGDETLSTKDTSQIFWENNFNKEAWLDFRNDFVEIGRNFDGYLKAAQRYSLIDIEEYARHCQNTSKLVKLRQGWSGFVENFPKVIVVTSGIKLLWEHVIKTNNWTNVSIVGGNHLILDEFIVDPDIKYELVKKLKVANKKVIAFGDSRVDAPMLKTADIGIVVANERKSPNLVEALQGAQNIYQIKMEEELLPSIPISSLEEILNKHL